MTLKKILKKIFALFFMLIIFILCGKMVYDLNHYFSLPLGFYIGFFSGLWLNLFSDQLKELKNDINKYLSNKKEG